MKYSTSINLGLGTQHYVNVPGKFNTRQEAISAAFKYKVSKHLAGKIVMMVEN